MSDLELCQSPESKQLEKLRTFYSVLKHLTFKTCHPIALWPITSPMYLDTQTKENYAGRWLPYWARGRGLGATKFVLSGAFSIPGFPKSDCIYVLIFDLCGNFCYNMGCNCDSECRSQWPAARSAASSITGAAGGDMLSLLVQDSKFSRGF